MLGRKVICVRYMNCPYYKIAKGNRLHDKIAIFGYSGKKFIQVRAFESNISLRFARIMHSFFFQSRLIMISLIKVSDSGPLGSLVGFKGVARLEASGSDKQPLPNHAIISKSSQDQV